MSEQFMPNLRITREADVQQTYDPDYPREDRDDQTVEILCDKLVYDYMTGPNRWNWHQIRQFFLDAYIDYYVDAMLSEGVVKHSLMVEHDIHRDDLMDAMWRLSRVYLEDHE